MILYNGVSITDEKQIIILSIIESIQNIMSMRNVYEI